MAFALTYCPPEVSPGCTGHAVVDRFPDCLTEALFCSDFDAWTGSVDGFGTWVGLVIQHEAEDIMGPGDCKVTIPADTYMVISATEHGHIRAESFPNAERAQAAYDDWEALYGRWLDASDMREVSIVSSTGRIGR